MGNRIMIVGDDLFTTNIETVRKGISGKWAIVKIIKNTSKPLTPF